MTGALPLVVGIGNRFRRDDGVGPAVVAHLQDDPRWAGEVDLVEADGEAARLVELWDRRPLAVVVDAVFMPDRQAGSVVVLEGEEATDPAVLGTWDSGVSGHAAGLREAVALGRVLERMPSRLAIVGVVAEALVDGDTMTDPVARAVPEAAGAVGELLAAVGTGCTGGGHVSV